jgi:Calcineurin-like phosphoesterase
MVSKSFFLGMLLITTRTCRFAVHALLPVQLSPWKRRSYAAVRQMSRHDAVDSHAPLSSFITLQSEYQLPQIPEDRLELTHGQRLVCFGDVHGDIDALKNFLQISKVYDGHRWVGGDTILVQCGNVLDRGPEELECFALLTSLSRQAKNEGGRVILLWGNHEVYNVAGLFHATTGDSEYEKVFGSSLDSSLRTNLWRLQFANHQPARWAAYEPGGLLAASLLANMKVAVQVGKTVCVHGGLTQRHLSLWGGLEGMNRMAREWIISRELSKEQSLDFQFLLKCLILSLFPLPQ